MFLLFFGALRFTRLLLFTVALANRNSWYGGGEVSRSKSDIVARHEVPPTSVKAGYQQSTVLPRAKPNVKLPHVSKLTSDMNRENRAKPMPVDYRRLSRYEKLFCMPSCTPRGLT